MTSPAEGMTPRLLFQARRPVSSWRPGRQVEYRVVGHIGLEKFSILNLFNILTKKFLSLR